MVAVCNQDPSSQMLEPHQKVYIHRPQNASEAGTIVYYVFQAVPGAYDCYILLKDIKLLQHYYVHHGRV
jgi:hypothetical protein